jgi:hypothetical protein
VVFIDRVLVPLLVELMKNGHCTTLRLCGTMKMPLAWSKPLRRRCLVTDIRSAVDNFELLSNAPGPWPPSVTERARELAIQLGDVLQDYRDLDETQILSALTFVTVAHADRTAADWGTGDNELVEYMYSELDRRVHALDKRWHSNPASDIPVGNMAGGSGEDDGELRPDSETKGEGRCA